MFEFDFWALKFMVYSLNKIIPLWAYEEPYWISLKNAYVICMVDRNVKYKCFPYGSDGMMGLNCSMFWQFGTYGFTNLDCLHFFALRSGMLYELGL